VRRLKGLAPDQKTDCCAVTSFRGKMLVKKVKVRKTVRRERSDTGGNELKRREERGRGFHDSCKIMLL
jgi:hypothetical protein